MFVPAEKEDNEENHRFRRWYRDSNRLPPDWITGALPLHQTASTDNRDMYGDSKGRGKNRKDVERTGAGGLCAYSPEV
jgi:hypothetical protein